MRKAIVETATGLVVNVIELEPGADWTPPDGCEVRGAGKSGPGCSWDGRRFSLSEPVTPSRSDILLWESAQGVSYANIEMAKTGADLAVDRAELLLLLHEKLQADPSSLTTEETQKMLQLERLQVVLNPTDREMRDRRP